jgi:ABC-type branched-subunit amino acid transport system permease subunit
MRWAGLIAIVLIVLALLPSLGMPEYIIGITISAFVFTICAVALNVIYGYLGLLSIAQVAFWGIGGYCTALMVVDAGASFWTALLASAVLNALVALAIGYPALRLNRHSFVVVTLSFSLLVMLISRDWVDLTRGPLGIPGLPAPAFFGMPIRGQTGFYYLCLAYAAFAIGFLYLFCTSRIGMVLRSLKQSEPLAISQGISPTPYKLLAFAVSAMFTGVAGGIFVFKLTLVDPLIFDFYYMQAFLIMVIVGGAGTFWPVVVAGMVMTFVPELLRFSNELRMVLFGVVLVATMLFAPKGVGGWLRERWLRKLRASL